MKRYETMPRDVLVDIICDICGTSCRTECSDMAGDSSMVERATLEAAWGYCSLKDGERYNCDMCEKCFDKIRAFIESLRTDL